MDLFKQVRSWSQPDGVPNLIGRKKVDKSVFRYGSHIPIEFHVDFEKANGGQILARGETRDVVLLLDDTIYNARLTNTDRKGVHADTLQIRWDSNHDLKRILEKHFDKSYNRFSETLSSEGEEEETYNEEIDELQEFIEFYQTGTTFQYRIELISANDFVPVNGFVAFMQKIMHQYVKARTGEDFGSSSSIWQLFSDNEALLKTIAWLPERIIPKWSVGQGNWAKVPWIAFLDSRITDTTQRGIYVVYVFREDMKGVYLSFMQGVTDVMGQDGLPRGRARQLLRERAESMRAGLEELKEYGFSLDNNINLNTGSPLGIDYEYGTIAYRYYDRESLLDDEAISRDLYNLLNVYDNFIAADKVDANGNNLDVFRMDEKVETLIKQIDSIGYVYEPWQIATYIAALKTKPFVILAGVSGTGKSKLPDLINKATGGITHLLPVRPDWTDSSDVLGYSDIQGRFRPASFLNWAREAESQPDMHHVCIMDEMNLARVEHYFAEVLSQIENRSPSLNGGYISGYLLNQCLSNDDEAWSKQSMPANMAIVGTVNMDESTYGFSRKVLDRAFTIELSEIDLQRWVLEKEGSFEAASWPIEAWYPRAIRISELDSLTEKEREMIKNVIKVLVEVNNILKPAQLQLAFRSRDEIVLFILHAQEIRTSFVTRDGEMVDPLDLAILMKVLPRIIGGSSTIRQILIEFISWANQGETPSDSNAEDLVERWISGNRPSFISSAKYPRTAARLCLMWERFNIEGFTSFWM